MLIAGGLIAALWAWNSSILAEPEGVEPRLLSHRGVHQPFDQAGVTNDTCTAARIAPPQHDYIENTLPSMRAAFGHGADVVELDIHLTPDKAFAVFHDWTLECRTNGQGVTEDTPLATLKTLDVGYGYTADGGRTYPLRGKGTGLMPALEEVLRAFPDRQFLINFKSRRPEEGAALAALLKSDPAWQKAAFGVYGGSEPTREALRATPGLRGYDKGSIYSCLGQYAAYGWTGIVPGACRNTLIVVPVNYGWALWGWPHRFVARMRGAGSEVILLGPYGGGGFTSGIDDRAMLDAVPKNFDGYIFTNRIEVIGPALKQR